MTIQTVIGFDATHKHAHEIQAGHVAAGYVTGSADVQWTAEDWAAHPGAVKIDQSPLSTVWDATADVQDYENSAVRLDELAPRVKVMLAAYHHGARPGQRMPAIYASEANITKVVNALIAGGVTGGVGLGVAHWGISEAEAAAKVATASGPFPIIWYQFANRGTYDEGVFSVPWLHQVSARPVQPPPGQWNHDGFTWRQFVGVGVGLDDKLHLFRLDGETWAKDL